MFPINTSGITTGNDKELVSEVEFVENNNKYSYKPFDNRFINYDAKQIQRARFNVMKHFLGQNKNVGLCLMRTMVNTTEFKTVFITSFMMDKNYYGFQSYIFPLYLYSENFGKEERTPNLNAKIVAEIEKSLGLKFVAEKFPSFGGVAESRGGFISSESQGAPKSEENQRGRNTQNYMSLPYNPHLKERAKELRKAGNLSEILFWNQVKNKQFKGVDFDRQKIIGNYIVDFYCANCNVVIEIDGSSHDDKQEYDAERDAFLESLGLTIIHIPVVDVIKRMGAVMDMLEAHPVFLPPRPTDTPTEEGKEPPRLSSTPPQDGNFAPIDLLDYIYAVLHSPIYREKYKEFLKIDFPRVPYPKDKETFWKLVELGKQIREIHLLESPTVEKYITQYPESGNNKVTKPRFINSPPLEGCPQDGEVGNVYINETQYFANVPLRAWSFYIGGYQPAQKWLKDRKDRTLEFDDIMHYQKIIVALSETNRLMKEIDTIEIE